MWILSPQDTSTRPGILSTIVKNKNGKERIYYIETQHPVLHSYFKNENGRVEKVSVPMAAPLVLTDPLWRIHWYLIVDSQWEVSYTDKLHIDGDFNILEEEWVVEVVKDYFAQEGSTGAQLASILQAK